MRQITAITVHPEIQDGSPVFSGTRVRVETFYDYVRIGVSVADFLSDYPSITPDQAQEAMALLKANYSLEQIRSLVMGPNMINYHEQTGRAFAQPTGGR